MKKCVTLIAFLLATAAMTVAQGRVVTTRKNLKVERSKVPGSDTTLEDTIRNIGQGDVVLSGFEKPLKSRNETMFLTNNTDYDLKGVVLECKYYDIHGRQLHERIVSVKCEIGIGATCMIGFKTWDVQGAFYYRLSQKPRRANGTPFDVKINVAALIISRNEPVPSVK